MAAPTAIPIESLAGAEWILRSWARDEPAPATPAITMKLDANQFVGSAGCNNYFAPVKAGQQPGDLEVGPVGATKKMCAEAIMAVETRFTRQLAAVEQWRLVGGQLVLRYVNKDRSTGVMSFERRAAR